MYCRSSEIVQRTQVRAHEAAPITRLLITLTVAERPLVISAVSALSGRAARNELSRGISEALEHRATPVSLLQSSDSRKTVVTVV